MMREFDRAQPLFGVEINVTSGKGNFPDYDRKS
jgi:hypothetical protein